MPVSISHSLTRLPDFRFAITMRAQFNCDPQTLYDFIVGEGTLPKTGYGLLPVVIDTSGSTGPWNTPGSMRTLHLERGATACERVTAFEPHRYFAYRLSEFSFGLRHLAHHATGEWRFEPTPKGTKVKWTYSIKAKGPLHRAVLTYFARTQWATYMKSCLLKTSQYCEQ